MGPFVSSAGHIGVSRTEQDTKMLTARLASTLARQLPRAAPQVCKNAIGAGFVAARNLQTSQTSYAAAGGAEVSSILEDRIPGQAPQANLEETGRVLSIGDGIARVYGLELGARQRWCGGVW